MWTYLSLSHGADCESIDCKPIVILSITALPPWVVSTVCRSNSNPKCAAVSSIYHYEVFLPAASPGGEMTFPHCGQNHPSSSRLKFNFLWYNSHCGLPSESQFLSIQTHFSDRSSWKHISSLFRALHMINICKARILKHNIMNWWSFRLILKLHLKKCRPHLSKLKSVFMMQQQERDWHPWEDSKVKKQLQNKKNILY